METTKYRLATELTINVRLHLNLPTSNGEGIF